MSLLLVISEGARRAVCIMLNPSFLNVLNAYKVGFFKEQNLFL